MLAEIWLPLDHGPNVLADRRFTSVRSFDVAMRDDTGSGDPQTADAACANDSVGRENAARLRVRDAMVSRPKTVPADATVEDLRAMFANPHVRTALLVEGSRFVGVVHRDQLDDRIAGDSPAHALASRDVPTTDPDAPLSEAIAVLDARDEHRLVVLDPDGEQLCGLLCLTRDRNGFCQS